MTRGSVSFTQGEHSDKNTTTMQWAPSLPQDLTANIYFQKSSQVETAIPNVRETTASKLGLTLKQASFIPMIKNMILPADSLSIFTDVIYVETKIISIAMIYQKKSVIILRGRYSAKIFCHTRLTLKQEEKNINSNFPHGTINNLKSYDLK